MKLVLSWLNDLSPVGDDAAALADALTHLGLQVEAVEQVGSTVAGVVTVRVVRTERHADAAKVHRVWVDAGDGIERHVWCGAFNMSVGDVIALATPGTTMPDGRLIEPRPILGIDSQGMLCSARELGLGDDHAGILIFVPGTPVGVPYGEALGLESEVVFDVDLTRNRPDCWGHFGAARDLAAQLHVAPPVASATLVPTAPVRSAVVVLIDGERCPRFTTLVMSGVTVGPSPDWISRRLTAAGMRSINNVVDVSNYVMLELNQPNHAYDLDTLGAGSFRIRLAVPDESIVTLDGAARKLDADDLLICDGNDVPIGLAGVMGGLDSEITESTTTIALEVAHFEQTAMTRVMNRHGIRSDAAGRFERGVDPYGMPATQARFVELLRLTCPGLVAHDGAVDARHSSLPPEHRVVEVRVPQVNRILGTSLDGSAIARLLDPIGYRTSGGDPVLTVALPTWRPDSVAEIDVIEEVARHVGYRSLGKLVPKSTSNGHLSAVQQRRRRVRDVLLGLGLSEVITETFLGDDDLLATRLATDVIRVTNPLVVGEEVLRPSMRPGMLRAITFNESHRRSGVRLFEIGHVYPPGDRMSPLPPEYESLGVAIAGGAAHDAVAVWRELAAAMGLGARIDQSVVPTGLHPTRSATLSVGRDVVGAVGEIHPDVLDSFGVGERVAWLELDLGRLLATDPKIVQWKATSRFPSADVDLAFSVPDTVPAERVDKAIRQAGTGLLVDLALFDVFRGRGLADDARSLAYRLRLQAGDRTLTDADIVHVREKAIALVTKLGGSLRT